MNEIKEMLSFAFLLSSAIEKSLEDGKISIGDVPLFISPLLHAQSAFTGLDKIKEEMSVMDEVKKAELIEWLKQEFDLKHDKVENLIENGLIIGLSLSNLIFNIKR